MAVTLTPSAPSGTDLISTDRASQNATLSALGTSNPDYLAALITAASSAIVRYCHREFALQTFTEVYSGGGLPYQEIQLSNFPVVEITRIATCPKSAILITNTDSTNQRATVATTATTLRLIRVALAVTTTSDLSFVTYPTLNTLAAAINGLGHGWSATVQSTFGLYPTADLLPLQGATSVLSTANGKNLEMYTEDLTAWGSAGFWLSPYGYVSDGPGWRLDAGIGSLVGSWPQGKLNIRIDYRAGFSEIPEDVQEACVQLIQGMYQTGLINNSVASAKLGPFAYTTLARATLMSGSIKDALAPYVDHASIIMRNGPDNP